MIHYFGGPIAPAEAAYKVWRARHGLVSFVRPDQINLVQNICSSWVLDNGAFTFWKQGKELRDWETAGFYDFVKKHNTPNLDFVLIPDTITGSEAENDKLCMEWEALMKPLSGVPVYHLHEPLSRLKRLCNYFPKVAIGSSGDYAKLKTRQWWDRMYEVVDSVCVGGIPITKLHGLRMMDPSITQKIPFASVDSSTVGRNVNLDVHWQGARSPKSKITRALVLVDAFEHYNGTHTLGTDTTVTILEDEEYAD